MNDPYRSSAQIHEQLVSLMMTLTLFLVLQKHFSFLRDISHQSRLKRRYFLKTIFNQHFKLLNFKCDSPGNTVM